MDQHLAFLNIERFRRLLETETDEARRQMIFRLIGEEEVKINVFSDGKNER
jgi:hypothetical protein